MAYVIHEEKTSATYDPWKERANAIVEDAAKAYRRYMRKYQKLDKTDRRTEFERNVLMAKIHEIEVFFKSDYGLLLSRGLAPVIWEKLQAEFDDAVG